jgi:hypothetical protein
MDPSARTRLKDTTNDRASVEVSVLVVPPCAGAVDENRLV